MSSDSAITPTKQLAPVQTAVPVVLNRHPEQQAFNLRDALAVVFKHRWLILAIFVLAAALTPVVFRFIPIQYRSEAVVLVSLGREHMRPNLGDELSVSRPQLADAIRTEISIMTSPDVLERVIQRIGIDTLFPKETRAGGRQKVTMELAAFLLAKQLDITNPKNSSLINIAADHERPEIAARIVNDLINAYKVKRLETLASDDRVRGFLDSKILEHRRKLQAAEEKLEKWRQETQIHSLIEDRANILRNKAAMEQSLKESLIQAKQLQDKLEVLEKQIKGVPEMITPEAIEQSDRQLEMQLLDLKRKEQELLSKYVETSPFVESVRNDIKLVEEFIAKKAQKEASKTVNPLYADLQKQINAVKMELNALAVKQKEVTQLIAAADEKLERIQASENTYRELQRDVEKQEQQLQNYIQKLDSLQVAEELNRKDITSISVIQQASVPLLPYKPKHGVYLYTAIAALLGLGGGLAISFMLESINQTFGWPQQIEKRLGLPVLITIPHRK
jgi:uncharacterized protein involved in exopolysaccharide biosynthesis